MKTTAITVTAPHQVHLTEVTLPSLQADEVLVAAEYTCISPGTELRCFNGAQADTHYPFIPGYALTGEIVASGDVVSLPRGMHIYCGGTQKVEAIYRMWGGHIQHAVVKAAEVYPLPHGVDTLSAAPTRLAAIALRGVQVAPPAPDERVAVIGLGVIGCLSALLYRYFCEQVGGGQVIAADRSAERVALAQSLGIRAIQVRESIADAYTPYYPNGASLVVDATGVPSVLTQAMALVQAKPWGETTQRGGRVVIQGSYAGDFAINYQDAFMKELSFFLPRDCQPEDIRQVLALIALGMLPTHKLISHVVAPTQIADLYTALATPNNGLLTAALRWKPN